MNDTYDNSSLTENCINCGNHDFFARRRNIIQREYLEIDEGFIDINSEDSDQYDEWIYYCVNCGVEGDDLEDLLAEIGREDES